MNKKLFGLSLALLISFSLLSQNGERGGFGGQRRTVAERVATVHAKFDSTFHFDSTKQAKVDTVFAEAYRAQDKLIEEMRANFTPGQAPDPSIREQMQEKNKEIQVARDEKLQEILTEEEYKKFKDELEPLLRPQRGAGGGGRGAGGGAGAGRRGNG